MRMRYTILFFADTLLLIVLSYLFLRKLDQGASPAVLVLTFSGIVASIFLLVRLLISYIRQPTDRERR
jgi:DMSO/TMAO reductase YedYZ heme-binding membrane subunit